MATLAAAETSPLETETMRRVTWRILPFLMLSLLHRVRRSRQRGFAALQMNHDIGLSAAAFGLGGGLFYISYVLCEVPSNLAMAKVGAKLWIARIDDLMGHRRGLHGVCGGALFVLCGSPAAGRRGGGFFPGVILYLTYWFPSKYRGRIVALFMVAIPLSSFFGSPISASLLQLDGVLGFHGWQWMFVLEALPAVILGVISFFLPGRRSGGRALARAIPSDSGWRAASRARIPHPRRRRSTCRFGGVMSNKYVLAASLIYAGASGASQCLSLWRPQIIKSFGLSNMQTGLLNSFPSASRRCLMILWGRSSDRSRNAGGTTALPLLLLAGSLGLAPLKWARCWTILCCFASRSPTYHRQGPVLGAGSSVDVGWHRRRRNRPGQSDRKSRRVLRQLPPRRHQGRHRQLCAGPAAARRAFRRRMHRLSCCSAAVSGGAVRKSGNRALIRPRSLSPPRESAAMVTANIEVKFPPR